jgi:site-specific DNA recombinase
VVAILLLLNERYQGVHVWNRTEKVLNPETGKKTPRRRPAAEILRVDKPEWRIIDDKLWSSVQGRFRITSPKDASRRGGLARSANSKKYLFSGLMFCGYCGTRITIIGGQGIRGYAKYGCPSHSGRAICKNSLTIRRDRLEGQLVAAIQRQLTNDGVIDTFVANIEHGLRRGTAGRSSRKKTWGGVAQGNHSTAGRG